MEILRFKDLGDTKVSSANAVWVFIKSLCRLAANAVVLVHGEYQISIAKYPRGVSTHM